MNQLGTIWVLASIQVTLLALPAADIYLLAARRGPDAGKLVSLLTIVLSAVLTLAAVCPLPVWWTWKAWTDNPAIAMSPRASLESNPSLRSPVGIVEESNTGTSKRANLSLSLLWFQIVWQQLEQSLTPLIADTWRWPAWLALALILGVSVSLLRLLGGWWGVRSLCQRAEPIQDFSLLVLLHSLRQEMACGSSIALRESTELRTPVTAGWLYPCIILPADWHTSLIAIICRCYWLPFV